MVVFKGEYYLFASKSGGYFHSTDLINWDLITTKDLPLEHYAPTAVVMNDTLYFMASAPAPVKIYKTADPKSGNWQVANAFLTNSLSVNRECHGMAPPKRRAGRPTDLPERRPAGDAAHPRRSASHLPYRTFSEAAVGSGKRNSSFGSAPLATV